MADILIIDDEMDIRELLSDVLIDEGYAVSTAHNIEVAKKKIDDLTSLKVIVLDIWLEGHHMDGIGLLRYIKKKHPNVPVIMISGHANSQVAVKAIKFGAYDFLEKPFSSEKLILMIQRATEMKDVKDVNEALIFEKYQSNFIGISSAIAHINSQIQNFALGNSRILIEGEYGTGKATLAHIIHSKSRRKNKLFHRLKVQSRHADAEVMQDFFGCNSNRATTLVSGTTSNLEGSGNIKDDSGRAINSIFERCNGGTLLIENVENLSLNMQHELLKIIENNAVNGRPIDCRIVCSTTKDLAQLVMSEAFLKALLTRIKVAYIFIPPLRERKQDIQVLSEYFLKNILAEIGYSECVISDNAYSYMMTYDWPGNITRLRNVIENLVMDAYKKHSSNISLEMMMSELQNFADEKNSNNLLKDESSSYQNILLKNQVFEMQYQKAKQAFDKHYLKIQLLKAGGSIVKAAKTSGIDRTTLYRKLKSIGIDVEK